MSYASCGLVSGGEAVLVERMVPPFGDTSVKGVTGLSSVGIATNVGKVASALLAKHVRTLEVLHTLQRTNAKLRQEIQVRKVFLTGSGAHQTHNVKISLGFRLQNRQGPICNV